MHMKRNALNLIVSVVALLSATAKADNGNAALLEFNQNSYVGWTYSRPNFKLDTDAISANKVNLYKASNGTDYTLLSPLFNCGGYNEIVITSTLYCQTVASGTYDLSRGYPTFELIGVNGDKLAAVDHMFDKAEQYHEGMVTKIVVPDGTKQARLRLAAWNADLNSPITVRELSATGAISGVESPASDVTTVVSGDGFVEIKNAGENATVLIYSADASLVKSGETHNTTTRTELPCGFYIVVVGNETFRVMVR